MSPKWFGKWTDEKYSICTFAVGSLMYAHVWTRADIAFAIRMLGRYQSNLGLNHWKVIKRIMCYLQGTKDNSVIIEVACDCVKSNFKNFKGKFGEKL